MKARIVVTIDVENYSPHYVDSLQYHVSPGRMEVLERPVCGDEMQRLMEMLHDHCGRGRVTINYVHE